MRRNRSHFDHEIGMLDVREHRKRLERVPAWETRMPRTEPTCRVLLLVTALLESRDYTGAITLVEFERKLFFEQKNASG